MERTTGVMRTHAFWCRIPSRPNFGDALTPWLIHRFTGQYPIFVRPEDRRQKYLAAGSIIAYASTGCTVWGSGIMSLNDVVAPAAKLLAVRGPLSRDRALACGADCPEVYGDPALLLPRLYRASFGQRRGVGVIGHFSDMPHLAAAWRPSDHMSLIDIQDPIETVIDAIASCEFVASSSLHGIIASHAYGVPAVWIKFRDLPSGDDSKFHDYYLSFAQDPPPPTRVAYDQIPVGILARRATLPSIIDVEALWQACPFRRSA